MSNTYLLSTPHGWYFRRAVPKELRSVIGKSVLKKPLHSRNLTEAKSHIKLLVAESEQLFQRLRETSSMIFSTHIKTTDVRIDDNGNIAFGSIEMDPNNLEAEKKALAAILTQLKPAQPSSNNQLTISNAIKLYTTEKIGSKDWTAKTAGEIKTALELILELHGDQSITDCTRDDALTIRDHLSKLPINRSKDPLYRTKSAAQILKMNKPAKCLSPTSVNKVLTRACALWDWAISQQYAKSNPFAKIQIKLRTKPNERRSRFSIEQINNLFNHPEYQNLSGAKYWAPLIAAYSGLRLDEICQLDTADITTHQNIYYFDINDTGNDKKLKTVSSRRKVPIHESLIVRGFLNYVAKQQQQQNSVKLFDPARQLRTRC